jgi:DNA primase
VTREDVTAEEPIYGLDTVEPGDPVLITEGIADAITAHEAGYPCISPVTVQFYAKC